MEKGKKYLVLLGTCLFLLMVWSPLFAVEGGLGVYGDGLTDFKVGALPPPGAYFINYLTYINISDYKDLRGPGGIKLKDFGETPRVRGWSVLEAPRLIYMSKCKLFGGDLGVHITIPFQHSELTKAQWGGVDLLAHDNTHSKTGVYNVIVGPGIGWHLSKNLHIASAIDITMPSGSYNANDMVNTGTGYWTFTPFVAVTYISNGGFEASGKFMYDINTTNKDTGYYSGQTFHADYAIGQNFGHLVVGVAGYYVKQLQDDTVRGAAPGFDGNKAEAFAIGPAMNYMYKNQCFVLKAQFDTYTKNRPETQRYWFNWVYAF